MDNKLIMPTEISIKDKKNNVKGNVIRAAFFARTKVIEVITTINERYYLIYYKNSFIYGDQLDKVEEGSFINKAFHEGIVIEAPHPILTAFIPNRSVSIPNKNKLFSQLQIHYSPDEMAYVVTTLDSFFESEQLVKLLDKIYFDYRRSGSFIKSFQVNRILCEFEPSLKSAKERMNSREYHSYHELYKSSDLGTILKKDPLFVEFHCFQNRSNPVNRIFLEEILKKKNYLVELLLLWLEDRSDSEKIESIESYTAIALQLITMKEWIFILGQVNINPFRELPEAKAMIEKMLREENYEIAALYLLNFIHDLPDSYDAILNTLWENLNADFIVSHLDDFLIMFQPHALEEHSNQTEQKIFQFAVNLLEEHSLKTVNEKLLPIQELLLHSKVIGKLNKMQELSEDPDRMMELGDYYAEFKQYDKAIDCYSWEMELQPQNPSPVKKISQMYQQKGMVNEAANYQKVYEQLKRN